MTLAVAANLISQLQDTTLDGRKVTSLFTWSEPNTLMEVQTTRKVNTTILRRFYTKGIDIEMEAKGVIARTIFSRKIAKDASEEI